MQNESQIQNQNEIQIQIQDQNQNQLMIKIIACGASIFVSLSVGTYLGKSVQLMAETAQTASEWTALAQSVSSYVTNFLGGCYFTYSFLHEKLLPLVYHNDAISNNRTNIIKLWTTIGFTILCSVPAAIGAAHFVMQAASSLHIGYHYAIFLSTMMAIYQGPITRISGLLGILDDCAHIFSNNTTMCQKGLFSLISLTLMAANGITISESFFQHIDIAFQEWLQTGEGVNHTAAFLGSAASDLFYTFSILNVPRCLASIYQAESTIYHIKAEKSNHHYAGSLSRVLLALLYLGSTAYISYESGISMGAMFPTHSPQRTGAQVLTGITNWYIYLKLFTTCAQYGDVLTNGAIQNTWNKLSTFFSKCCPTSKKQESETELVSQDVAKGDENITIEGQAKGGFRSCCSYI